MCCTDSKGNCLIYKFSTIVLDNSSNFLQYLVRGYRMWTLVSLWKIILQKVVA